VNTREIAFGSIIAALYAITVILLAPISFLLFQVRIADALIPLSIIFGVPVIWGVTLGNIVANIYGGLGIIDIIGGSVANLCAAYIGWRIGSRNFLGSQFVATVAQNLIVSSIVGFYLAVLFEVPLELGFFSVLTGSLISMNLIGYFLVLIIQKIKI
jgi:uncharacterized membrane protein